MSEQSVSADLLQKIAERAYEAVVVKPGDKLIIRVAERHLDQERAVMIRRELMIKFPELDDVVIINCDQLAVVRGGGHE
jgi:protein involved in polysaccharide export with SLBB domain